MKNHPTKQRLAIALAAAAAMLTAALPASAITTITTEFNTSDGFITGDFAPATVSAGGFTTTFSGGQQQQMFDFPSYSAPPAAYLFINGGTGFTGASGNTAASTGDTGLIDFNRPVSDVSFFAANRANGPATTLTVFGIDDTTVLGTLLISQTAINAAATPTLTEISSSALGGFIGSIGIDLPGPASPPNSPYVLAIDTFSASAVPEPTTAVLSLMAIGSLGLLASRRRTA